jgi:DNA-binding GntR family transcriptional regulator
MKFERLRQSTTPDDVYSVVRNAILDGGLPPGSALREEKIAGDLGISRAPLREALRRLEEQGLVVKIPFRGAFVAEISAQTISEITALRSVLEPYAAELAMEDLRGPHRGQILKAADRLSKASRRKDLAATIDEHLRFHRLFYKYSGNAMLLDVWNAWESRLRLYLVAEHHLYEDLIDLSEVHKRLADVVLEGDPQRLREAIVEHLQDSRLRFLADGSAAPA